MLRKIAGLMLVFTSTAVYALSDNPDVSDWDATGYQSDWFSYGVKRTETGVKIASSEQFLVSPHYPSPIRKVVLKVSCDDSSPTRTLKLKPMVGGREKDDKDLVRELERPQAEGVGEYIHFDWEESSAVDALRICLGGSGSEGSWIISEIHIFYGEKTADEDEIVRDLVKELPPPSGVRIDDFSATSLSVKADVVEFASGYEFEVRQLLGQPRTEAREDFAAAPSVSENWSLTCEKADVGSYTAPSYRDEKSGDNYSLKITSKTSKAEPVSVEIVSPVLPSAVSECSFMYKVLDAAKSDKFEVFGADGNGGAWQSLLEVKPQSTTKAFANVKIDKADAIKQIKIVFTAYGNDFANAAIDSVSIVSGGDEEGSRVLNSGVLSEPGYSVSGLETGRYAVKAKALAVSGSQYGDSSWSDEVTVDLSWADLEAGKPGDVVCETSGGALRISWGAAENAGYYLVSVATLGVPSEVVAQEITSQTSIDIALSELGEYVVTVTAFSPGGKTSAAAEPLSMELKLEAVGKVTATAVDRESLTVKWPAVPLSEGYRVRVFELGGETAEFTGDYSRLPELWPEGWTHYEFLVRNYPGPFPKIDVRNCWIATCAYPMPVTKAMYSFKSHASAELTALTRIAVDVSSTETGEDWVEDFAIHSATTSKQELELEIPYAMGVRRLRFRFLFDEPDPYYSPALEFGTVTVVCGEQTRREVASLRSDATSTLIGGLTQDGCFVVEVTPLPSEGDALSSVSGTVDLSLMRPRSIEPVAISDFAGAAYTENFDCLSGVKKETSLKEITLPHWQFWKGDDTAETLKFTATGKATAGGAYVMASGADSSARAIGTLSTSSYGCMFGIAFTNDLHTTIESLKLSFTAVQRSFKNTSKSYVLEYLVSDGNCGIDSPGNWTALEIPQVAPLTVETRGELEELRSVIGPIELPSAIRPGGALLLRWRDLKGAASPMMGIDDVDFSCSARPRSTIMILR